MVLTADLRADSRSARELDLRTVRHTDQGHGRDDLYADRNGRQWRWQCEFRRLLDLCRQVRLALGQERYDPRCDLNGDGEIGFGDFLIFAAGFGSTG